MIRVQVKMFAVGRDIVGADVVELELVDSAKIADLRAAILNAYPEFSRLGGKLMFSKNTEYAVDDESISETDELACIPPVSGG